MSCPCVSYIVVQKMDPVIHSKSFIVSLLFPRYHLCSSKERTAVCRHLYGDNRRGDLRDAPDEKGRISASGGHFYPLL